jgi:hypothetical protein
MSEYFRKIRKREQLIANERSPVTGRRVSKARSKQQHHAGPRLARGFPRWVPVAALSTVAAVSTVAIVAAVSGGDSSSKNSAAPVVSLAPTASTALTALESSATDVPTTTVESTTSAPPTTLPVTTLTAIVPALIRLTSASVATGVSDVAADPGAEATFVGVLPTYNFALQCSETGCNFSLRAFWPGSVTPDGSTLIPAVGGRYQFTSSSVTPCNGSGGTQYSRQVTTTLDLAESNTQVVDGRTVPARLVGSVVTVFPEAGYVPHVPYVNVAGVEIGCAGQTLTFTVDAPLAP